MEELTTRMIVTSDGLAMIDRTHLGVILTNALFARGVTNPAATRSCVRARRKAAAERSMTATIHALTIKD